MIHALPFDNRWTLPVCTFVRVLPFALSRKREQGRGKWAPPGASSRKTRNADALHICVFRRGDGKSVLANAEGVCENCPGHNGIAPAGTMGVPLRIESDPAAREAPLYAYQGLSPGQKKAGSNIFRHTVRQY